MQREHTFFRGRKWLAAAVSCLFVMGLYACGGGGGEEGGGGEGTPEMTIMPTPTGDHPDTIASAAAIADGETVDGSIDSPDDEDFFRLDVPEGTSVIDITLRAEAGVEVALLDGDGNVLGVAETVEGTASQAGGAGPVAAAASPSAVPLLVAVGLRVALPHASRAAARYLIRLASTPQGRAFLLRNRGTARKLAFKLVGRALTQAALAGSLVNVVRGIPNATLPIGRTTTVTIDLRQHFGVQPSADPPPSFDFKVGIGVGVPKRISELVPALRNVGLTVVLERSTMRIGTTSDAAAGPVRLTVSASIPVPGTEGVISAVSIPFTVTKTSDSDSPVSACFSADPPAPPIRVWTVTCGEYYHGDAGANRCLADSIVSQCPRTAGEFSALVSGVTVERITSCRVRGDRPTTEGDNYASFSYYGGGSPGVRTPPSICRGDPTVHL